MSNPQAARSEPCTITLSKHQHFALGEAQTRLRHACLAFKGFMAMLAGGSTCHLDPQEIFFLLQPVEGELIAALDEMDSIEPSFTKHQ